MTMTKGSKVVHDALIEFQKARVTFVDTVNTLVNKGDGSVDDALLDGDILSILCMPLVQGKSHGTQTRAPTTTAPICRIWPELVYCPAPPAPRFSPVLLSPSF